MNMFVKFRKRVLNRECVRKTFTAIFEVFLFPVVHTENRQALVQLWNHVVKHSVARLLHILEIVGSTFDGGTRYTRQNVACDTVLGFPGRHWK